MRKSAFEQEEKWDKARIHLIIDPSPKTIQNLSAVISFQRLYRL